MGFREKSYAKIWEIENKGNYHVASMSVSKKNKETGKYDVEWQNKFVRLVGTAHAQAESLKTGDSVKIGACDVSNKYDNEKKITYTNYVIFGFEKNDNNGGDKAPTTPPAKATPTAPAGGFYPVNESIADDDLPF